MKISFIKIKYLTQDINLLHAGLFFNTRRNAFMTAFVFLTSLNGLQEERKQFLKFHLQ